MSKTKVCVFCGATPLSKEHIYSDWTYQILPKTKGAAHVRGAAQTAKGNPRIKGLRYSKSNQGEVNTIKVRAVCRSRKSGTNSLGKTGCNNGWMNHQEEAVKSIISPLILGERCVLSREDQLTLASWAATKFMVAEQDDPECVVSIQEERTFVMEHRRPPTNWRIWVAHQTGREWRTGYAAHSATLGPLDRNGIPVPPDGSLRKNTQLATLGLGFLVLHAFITRVPEAQIDYPSSEVSFSHSPVSPKPCVASSAHHHRPWNRVHHAPVRRAPCGVLSGPRRIDFRFSHAAPPGALASHRSRLLHCHVDEQSSGQGRLTVPILSDAYGMPSG